MTRAAVTREPYRGHEGEWYQTDPWTSLRESGVADQVSATTTPEQEEHLRNSLIEGLQRSVFAKSFAAKAASGDTQVRTAGDVLGERIYRLLGILICPDSELEWKGGRAPGWSDSKERCALAMRGLYSSPYLWLWNCVQASRSLTLPRHVISRSILPHPRLWWTYTDSIALFNPLTGEELGVLDALIISDEGPAFTVSMIGSDGVWPDTNKVVLWNYSVEYGKTWPDDFDASEPVGAILKELAFLNSRYIPKYSQRPLRGERRAAERAGQEAPDVTFVALRHAEPPKVTSGQADAAQVEWMHRWVVSGHYRAQWYPSESAHHVIYIEPYLKGPENAPLLAHAYKVAR